MTTVLGGAIVGKNGEKQIFDYTQFSQPYATGLKNVREEIDLTPYMIDGDVIAEIMFFDQVGNVTTLPIEAGQETGQPNIYIVTPSPYQTFNGQVSEIEVKFSVFDVKFQPKAYIDGNEVKDVVYEDVTIRDSERVLRAGMAYTFTQRLALADLKQGMNQLEVLVRTGDERFERQIVRPVFVDTVAPKLSVELQPRAEGAKYVKAVITASDETSSWATLLVNGSQEHYFDHGILDDQLIGFTDTHTMTLTLREGENVFEFLLVDDFGNETVEVIRIIK